MNYRIALRASINSQPCSLCKNNEHIKIHKGTRDNPNIDVLKCNRCGLVSLSDFSHITDTFYQNSGMRDFEVNFNLEISRAQTKTDDLRRADTLKEIYENKSLLDFGCGNGGFLSYAKDYCRDIAGVEIEESVVDALIEQGFSIKINIDEFKVTFDVITMFHVIEHFVDPIKILEQIKRKMNKGSKLIIETPNADDALLSLYQNNNFADFTYWSPHVYLYNSSTLESLLQKAGFKILWNKQIQRYSLANHLYWLAFGKAGGHEKWIEFNSKSLTVAYERVLQTLGICDTLLVCVEKI